MEQNYIDLITQLLKHIDDLDSQTPWQATEPKWWLEMMSLRKNAQDSLQCRLASQAKYHKATQLGTLVTINNTPNVISYR